MPHINRGPQVATYCLTDTRWQRVPQYT